MTNLFDLDLEKRREDAVDVAKELADTLVRAREEYEKPLLPIDDFELTLGLEVYATWQKGSRGYHEKGGQQIDPDEPAGYEIHEIFCKGRNITFLFSDDDIERLAQELTQ